MLATFVGIRAALVEAAALVAAREHVTTVRVDRAVLVFLRVRTLLVSRSAII